MMHKNPPPPKVLQSVSCYQHNGSSDTTTEPHTAGLPHTRTDGFHVSQVGLRVRVRAHLSLTAPLWWLTTASGNPMTRVGKNQPYSEQTDGQHVGIQEDTTKKGYKNKIKSLPWACGAPEDLNSSFPRTPELRPFRNQTQKNKIFWRRVKNSRPTWPWTAPARETPWRRSITAAPARETPWRGSITATPKEGGSQPLNMKNKSKLINTALQPWKTSYFWIFLECLSILI